MSKKFIDISEHNTILSFDRLKTANLSGAIMKATEGTTYVDTAHETYYELLNGSVPIGYYHFLRITSEPETQAQNFWEQIKSKTYQILPFVDVETYNGNDELGDSAEDYTQRFIQEFRNLSGQEMGIYSGRCYIEEHFTESFKSNNVWWVADYSANDTPTINNCKVIAWQYTEDCKSYDFNLGDLDCNILIDEDSFYIEPIEIPYSDESLLVDDYDSIINLQKELNSQCFTDYNWNEIEEDGLAGELTLSACPTLTTGATGNITKWVQKKLGVTSDGVFGEETRQAIIEYQSSNCLKGDGIVGKDTWRKILGMRG